MFLKRWSLMAGLSLLIVGCTTGYYPPGQIDNKLATYEGNSNARMGVRYLFGRGVPQDNQKAFAYFNKAAVSGDAFAQNELGYMYAAGKGTQQSYKEALNWYKKAANNGIASAQYSVGFMYLHGLGAKQNKEVAMKWIQKSADAGFEPAKAALEPKA